MLDADTRKKIESLVKEMNSEYKNRSEPKVVGTVDVGRVRLHTLSFLGEEGYPLTNYVTEFKDDFRAFRRVEDTIGEINKGLGFTHVLLEHGRVAAVALLAVVLVLVVAYLAISGREINSTINNLTVLLVGYLAGKGDTRAAK